MGDTTQTLLPVITIKSNVPITNSRDVAAFFGKQHSHVLRAIDALECSPAFRQSNFGSAVYLDAQDKPRPSIDMTKDGFVFLVMGFTGRKAATFKEAYIARFNEMESALRAQAEAELAALRHKREWLTVDQFRAERGERWPRSFAPELGRYASLTAMDRGVRLRRSDKCSATAPGR